VDLNLKKRKRLLDLLLGLPLALASLPVVMVLAVGSAVVYGAWPLFIQERLGAGGRTFTFVKIRSLPTTTSAEADKYELRSVDNHGWGRFLRRYHLDELPQLWHVVWGKMSLVGPRPEMPFLSDTFDRNFVGERLSVKPGCTGLWQISTSSGGLINEAPEFDLHYVRNWTLRLDLWVLARTAFETFGGSSLKDIGQIPLWTGAGLEERAEVLA
jgi:lipopolysaccharide/colanic/teichoic acid biosynthesis glycosyltransferase